MLDTVIANHVHISANADDVQEEELDSVQERIARIGHKLIAEAFMLPTRPRTAEPVSNAV
jgi:hypothetical protein